MWQCRSQPACRVHLLRRFKARHTSFHSAATRCRPRKLNWRNPRTVLIHPSGGSAIHLRFRYAALPCSLQAGPPSASCAGCASDRSAVAACLLDPMRRPTECRSRPVPRTRAPNGNPYRPALAAAPVPAADALHDAAVGIGEVVLRLVFGCAEFAFVAPASGLVVGVASAFEFRLALAPLRSGTRLRDGIQTIVAAHDLCRDIKLRLIAFGFIG